MIIGQYMHMVLRTLNCVGIVRAMPGNKEDCKQKIDK